ncbi:transposase [uncultured Virgibacillus sp.]|uniref:transposase n=1 Tax=uncultured Virgibacillus sp. TaxID=417355 RepID=UPI00261D4055|nr:transposase [uncultured Virgibacillus sp.]
MAKYSEEFKGKVVTEYIDGNLSYRSLAKKYHMSSSTPIYEWVKNYERHGMAGLKRRNKKKEYAVQFKLDTIQFMLETGASYRETAVPFKLSNSSIVKLWMKKFRRQGKEGLELKRKGHPSMPKKPINQKKQEAKKRTREEELERENELLRLENAYLKKLKAFRENPNAFYEKHRQRWHSNSKKKDSD